MKLHKKTSEKIMYNYILRFPESMKSYTQTKNFIILQKRVLVKQIAETAEKQNSSYACVINYTNLKPNILSIREKLLKSGKKN